MGIQEQMQEALELERHGEMGAAALGLNHLRTANRLGRPGVRLSAVPVFNESQQQARTNSIAFPTSVPGYRARVEPISKIELNNLPPDTTYARRSE